MLINFTAHLRIRVSRERVEKTSPNALSGPIERVYAGGRFAVGEGGRGRGFGDP